MLSPRFVKYSDRLRELVQEGQYVAQNAESDDGASRLNNPPEAHAWAAKSHQILSLLFSSESHYVQGFDKAVGTKGFQDQIFSGIAYLSAALTEIEGGFIRGQEVAIASEVFDSVLEQASYLNDHGYKDAAAVLARVVLENALKRVARQNGIGDSKNAMGINDDLKAGQIIPQTQWRLNQARLDLGNEAAHGHFDKYSEAGVKEAIDGIGQFLATYFR